ncbi:MAG TPA: NTP transferase domain-containing protein [Gaiellaceae bacterium]|nr:NTP transferase domain-containing protein [Gaiellaceae bacterium]
MASVVVPFRGADPKQRLDPVPQHERMRLALAMLADVLDAAVAVGPTFVVAPGGLDLPAGAVAVDDPQHGQGLAVQAGLDAALAAGAPAPYLVVNADLPCVTARDLLALAGAVPDRGLALVAAADGTTNALAFADAALFEPCYGPGSSERFASLARSRLVDAPNLIDDVDTLADLARVASRLRGRTRRVFETLQAEAA